MSPASTRVAGPKRSIDGRGLPVVRHWLAWNEPNNPAFLRPQYKRVGGKWVVQSAVAYAKMSNATYPRISVTALGTSKVDGDVAGPRGAALNRPSSVAASIVAN